MTTQVTAVTSARDQITTCFHFNDGWFCKNKLVFLTSLSHVILVGWQAKPSNWCYMQRFVSILCSMLRIASILCKYAQNCIHYAQNRFNYLLYEQNCTKNMP